MKSNVDIIADLQFGSTGKGLLAGYLAKKIGYDVAVTANAPNAGHTYIEADGTKWVVRQLPVAAALPSTQVILVGPGAVIDPEVFLRELIEIRDRRTSMGRGRMPIIMIHPHAAVVTPAALERERSLVKIGSTMKGSGAALVAKLMRDPDDRAVAKIAFASSDHPLHKYVVSPERYAAVIDNASRIMIEGSQGYSLGVNSGFWPYTTSRECTPAQMLSDTLIPWNRVNKVVGVLRTFPIRVANRFDADGNMIGTSGPCYPDQQEVQFEDLGVEPEVTTVTKLRRRVFTFSTMQAAEAIRACRPSEIFLNFANYCPDQVPRIINILEGLINENHAPHEQNGGVRYVGWGPKESDVREMNNQYTMDMGPDGKRIKL